MIEMTLWSRETYQSSISSRCWAFTPYDLGWDRCPELRTDEGLRQLVHQENSLSPIPQWAQEIVERSINYPPYCPHWAFPSPYLEVLDGIGKQTSPTFVHGCYTASRDRKARMQDYVFCLDTWLAGAEHQQAAFELIKRGYSQTDWPSVCAALWDVIGERSELKALLLRRIVHRQRWWIKSLVWDDDRRDIYGRDQFLGNVDCEGNSHYGNPEFRDPYFAELRVPEVRKMEERLSEICPDWPVFRSMICDSWLCAPKAFRFLERLLWCVGKEEIAVSLPDHPLDNGDKVPAFLQCEDTYGNSTEGKEWVRDFVDGIRSWIAESEPSGMVASDIHRRLADPSLVKLWLVGLYLRKIEFLNPYGALGYS